MRVCVEIGFIESAETPDEASAKSARQMGAKVLQGRHRAFWDIIFPLWILNMMSGLGSINEI